MKQKIIFPKVGMRIIKTFIAVLICAMIGFFLNRIPFYSMIAAVLCLQSDIKSSLKTALSRTIGTFIGGAYGLILLLIVSYTHITPLSFFYYLLTSLCTIPLIYTTVLCKQTSSAYITCVVFFSITISHITDISPFYFVWLRVSETLIGIAVALVINYIIKNKKVVAD